MFSAALLVTHAPTFGELLVRGSSKPEQSRGPAPFSRSCWLTAHHHADPRPPALISSNSVVHRWSRKQALFPNDDFYKLLCILLWSGSHDEVEVSQCWIREIPLIKFLVQGVGGAAAYIWLSCCLSAVCSSSQVKLSSFAHHACFPGSHTCSAVEERQQVAPEMSRGHTATFLLLLFVVFWGKFGLVKNNS